MTVLASKLFAICILFCLSFGVVFAQNDSAHSKKSDDVVKLEELDALLSVSVPATLTGLSLTGASFLVRITKDASEEVSKKITVARKSFILAFVMFVSCIVSIFIFDFIEILRGDSIPILLLDLSLTYVTFGIGLTYLVKSARWLYSLFMR